MQTLGERAVAQMLELDQVAACAVNLMRFVPSFASRSKAAYLVIVVTPVSRIVTKCRGVAVVAACSPCLLI